MSLPLSEIARHLAEAVGPNHLSTSPADTLSHALDYSARQLIIARDQGRRPSPTWVVWPGAAAEVSQVLRIASAHGIPVIPFGAGSSLVGGAAPRSDRPCLVMCCRRMGSVLELDEVSLTAHVQTGILGVELEEQLNERGLSLGHLPTSMTSSTLGGWLATRSAGLHSARYGRISDLCLGLTAVLADGTIIHTHVTPRHSAGPELMHLLFGSEGTLAVLTTAHLRLHRLPPHRQFDAWAFPDLTGAARTLQACLALGLRPTVARAGDDPRRRRPPGAEGPEADLEAATGRTLLVLAFDGPAEVTAAEQSVAQDLAQAAGGEPLGPAPARRWWGERLLGAFRIGARLQRPGAVVDVVDAGATWDVAPAVIAALRQTFARLDLSSVIALEHPRLEGACVAARFWGTAPADEAPVVFLDRIWREVGPAVHGAGGHLAHVFGAGAQRRGLLDPEAEARLRLLAGIKRKLDPAGILNPGVLG